MFKVACVQTNSTSNIHENIARASSLIIDAAKSGANLVLIPENVAIMDVRKDNILIPVSYTHLTLPTNREV